MTGPRLDFIYLSEADMIAAGVTDMSACMHTMEKMFAAMGVGDYVMGGPSRNSHGIVLDFPDESPFPNMPVAGTDRRFMAMPAYLGGEFDSVGVKWYGSNTENRQRGLPRSIHLFTLADKGTGAPLAVMSANLLSAYRTGAIPGVGAAYLAKKDSAVIGIVGPGVMNTTALESFLVARPSIELVKVAGRSEASTTKYVERARQAYPHVKIDVVSSPEEAVRGSDIISVATSSPAGSVNYPTIEEAWVAPGAFLAAPATINLDAEFVLKRARNIADSSKLYETYLDEMGAPAHEVVGILGVFWNDLIAAGRLDRTTIGDLGSIIAGRSPGRRSDDEIILFAIGGMPVEDVAWATTVYHNAVSRGIGTSLNLWDTPALA